MPLLKHWVLVVIRMTKRYISPQSGPVEDAIVVGGFTPAEDEAKERYMSGEFVSNPMAKARWNRFMRKVRAEAWRYGYQAALNDRHSPMFQSPNPYESEEA